MKPIDLKDGFSPHLKGQQTGGFYCGGVEALRRADEPCTAGDYARCDALIPQEEPVTHIPTDKVTP